MKKFALISLALILVLALTLPTFAKEPEDEGDIICAWGTPVIDGVKDALYDNADKMELIFTEDCFNGGWVGEKDTRSEVYFANDNDYFYLFAQVWDETFSCKESENWAEDCFELFLHDYGTSDHVKLHFTRSHPTGGVVASAGENFQYCDIDMEEEVVMKVIDNGENYVIEAQIPMNWNPQYNPDGSESDEVVAHICFNTYDFCVDDFDDRTIDWTLANPYADLPFAGKGFGGRTVDDGGMYLVFAEKPEETEAPVETEAPAEETEAPAAETEAPSDEPSPVTADIAVIAAGIALAAAAVVVFKKH